jgi:hypothetical protein
MTNHRFDSEGFFMTKTVMAAAFFLGVLLLTGQSIAQDADEVAKLKQEIELLKKENDLLARENALLKKELETQKKGEDSKPKTNNGFEVGTKLAGTVTRGGIDNKGKPWTEGGDVELTVTKRSGKEFTAELWYSGKLGFEIEGTIDGVVMKFKTTKSLTDATDKLAGLHTFTGRFDKGVLTGTTKKKGDPSYRGEWKLKTKE